MITRSVNFLSDCKPAGEWYSEINGIGDYRESDLLDRWRGAQKTNETTLP